MNNSNEVIISGKSYELPDNKVKFTTLTDLIEAKDFARARKEAWDLALPK